MAEARKIFPITTFVSCIKGEGQEAYNESVLDLLSYMTQAELNAEQAPFASALTKAWIYEQHPDLTQMSATQFDELGENVSVSPISDLAQAEVASILAKLAGFAETIASKDAKIAELEADLEAKGKKIAALEGKVKEFEASQVAEADKLFVTTEKRVEEFTAKLEALLKEVDEVKKTGVVVAGVAGAAPAAGGESSGAPAEEGAGDDFGFGGGAADPFAAEDW